MLIKYFEFQSKKVLQFPFISAIFRLNLLIVYILIRFMFQQYQRNSFCRRAVLLLFCKMIDIHYRKNRSVLSDTDRSSGVDINFASLKDATFINCADNLFFFSALDLCSLTGSASHIIQLSSSHSAMSYNLNSVKQWRIERESLFYTYT